MGKLRKTIYIFLSVIVVVLAICSLLSILRNTESRFLKMLDFPRIQFFITSLISLIALAIIIRKWRWYDALLIAGALCGVVINGVYLKNYTSLVPKEVPTVTDIKSSDVQFSLLIANVKMSNRKAQPLIDLIEDRGPDLVLAMEVDQWWDNALNGIEEKYPYSQETINEVTYGMALYSKFPIKDIAVNYLHNENVPSFEGTIALSNDRLISFYGIHPVPPTHFEDLPDNAGQEEVAMKILGDKVKDNKLPTVVAGDLNDVVWSHVDELTGTKDILYDVRTGRGFYNSYNAKNIFMRWPLDQVFVTKEFRLKSLERLPEIGSDHFPIYVELVL